jgi:predicted RNA-binding Zn-ribbon protein involved in translation (DUF1610 family)
MRRDRRSGDFGDVVSKEIEDCGDCANLLARLKNAEAHAARLEDIINEVSVELLLWCPQCHERHIDQGEFATKLHHTHACQSCGFVWRPAKCNTVGVKFLAGFGPAS